MVIINHQMANSKDKQISKPKQENKETPHF
jgi:hypothetical protein